MTKIAEILVAVYIYIYIRHFTKQNFVEGGSAIIF